MRSWDNIHIARQMLHAERLGIIHPVTEKFVEFKAETPEDMKRVRTLLRRLNRS